MSYSAEDLVYDLIGRTLDETKPDPRRTHRQNYAIALLSLDPGKSNALVARLIDAERIALTFACRAPDQTIHVGEAIIPRKSWSTTVFERYAKAMSKQPN